MPHAYTEDQLVEQGMSAHAYTEDQLIGESSIRIVALSIPARNCV